MLTVDLIIIGAGPGGYETALLAARRGLSVALFEQGEVGGTCLNEGCIPTKALCRTAAMVTDFRTAGEFGITDASFSVDFAAVMARKRAVVEQLRGGVETLLSQPGIHLVRGKAQFVDALTVEAAGERVTAKDVIIATGSSAAMLPIEGATLDGVVTSREILDLESVPKRLCIIGAGVIGLEFASVFNALGSEVTVMEYAKEILPHFDSDLAKRLRQSLGKRGIKIETQSAVKAVWKTDGGLTVAYDRKGKEQTVEADKVLMAVGRKANVGSLNLDDIGVAYDRRGITVDSQMQTNIAHVYAVGDVNGLMMLAHAATFQGVRTLNAIMGIGDSLRLDVVPAAVFTMPEVGMVGLTEDDCKDRGIAYTAKKAFFRANGKAVCLGETDGYAKLIVGDDGTLLGCHIYGPHAADLVQEACALISSGGSLADLQSVIHPHPTLSEILQSAANA